MCVCACACVYVCVYVAAQQKIERCWTKCIDASFSNGYNCSHRVRNTTPK